MEDKDLTRRNLLTVAGAAGLGAIATQALAAQQEFQPEAATQQVTAPGTATREGSGRTATAPQVYHQTVDVARAAEAAPAAAGAPRCFFGRVTPDPSPGRNTLTISGLPQGTRCISVWMTEFVLPNNPHAGAAFFYTTSVQLYNDGTQCRVIYNLDWNRTLPAAAQVIFM